MSQYDMNALAQMILDANRGLNNEKLSGSVQQLKQSLLPNEVIELMLKADTIDGPFYYDGFLIVTQNRLLYLNRNQIVGLWSSRSWRFNKIRGVEKSGAAWLYLEVEEEGSNRRLLFTADYQDRDRVSYLVALLEESINKEG